MNNHAFVISKLCSEFGIRHAVICPGSRSAPLVFAFSRNKKIKTCVIVDERSAAYLALGMAQQLQKPVVLICTSGTAALNFYPAIAEAYYQKIPLVVLTADRPEEYLNQQDGQMINQANVYDKHVRANINCTESTHQNKIQDVLSKSMFPVFGPVHINVPLKEPLYILPESKIKIQKIKWNKSKTKSTNSYDKIIESTKFYNKKIVVVGQLLPNKKLAQQIKNLQKKGFVIFADVVSNQQESSFIKHFDFIISNANSSVLKELEPEFIISFGGPLVSKSLKTWLKNCSPKTHIRIQEDKNCKVNTYGNVTDFILGNPTNVLFEIAKQKQSNKQNSNLYLTSWQLLEKKAINTLEHFMNSKNESELKSVNLILKTLPQNSQLQISNSSSIRYVSYAGLSQNKISVFANRGVSGIDGCSSTALGSAMITDQIVTLITGDLAFFYDRNAFWNEHNKSNLRLIIVNNNGGGIFNLIDGPQSQPELNEFFLTKHKLTAKNLCKEFGLEYYFCRSNNQLKKTLHSFFNKSKTAKILELKFDMDENTKEFLKFKNIKIQ